MFDGYRDDTSYWINFRREPQASETLRMQEIAGDIDRAHSFAAFGLRPYGLLDIDPYGINYGLRGPAELRPSDFSDEPCLVDIYSGFRFLYDRNTDAFCLDWDLTNNWLDAFELLLRAAERPGGRVSGTTRPVRFDGSERGHLLFPQPIEFNVSTHDELRRTIDDLHERFVGHGARKLWLRGQTREWIIPREAGLTQRLYGCDQQASIIPSLGRYAADHPENMHFGFAFRGPGHFWKKPFLIWLMRENEAWFRRDPRCLVALERALQDDDDGTFARLLGDIQLSGVPLRDNDPLAWPDEADDLRQWFFASMKRFEFGITLQQYGYYSSLLDLTESLDVALYFTQAKMVDRKMTKSMPLPDRVIYVFAERSTGDFFRSGTSLFWGDQSWVRNPPPRLALQKAGFLSGSTDRLRNFYSTMTVAKIWIKSPAIESNLVDGDLFPRPEQDLLYATLRASNPPLEGLY